MPDPLAALQGLLGEAYARPADSGDAVDGVAPRCVASPGSLEEVAATLRLADEAGFAVLPRGGGSKLGWGAPPRRADVVLSTARLDAVLEHAAGDLVVRAQAGVRLEALQARLAGAGQWLALDPPEPAASLGGIVAAAASGPRRHRYGTPRDLLIGVTVALADGTVARAGGKVVKNVAGYDLCKLFTGAFGTLGVIVETTFRVHPKPLARQLVMADLDTPVALGAALHVLLRSALVPSALECACSSESAAGALAVLFEGVPAGAVAQAEQAQRLLAAHGRPRIVPEDAVDAAWGEFGGPNGDAIGGADGGVPLRLKLSGVVLRVPDMIEAVGALARERRLRFRIAGQAGLGVLSVTLVGGDPSRLADAVEELRGQLGPEVRVVVREAPLPVKGAIDVWGDPGDALPLMKRVKQRFDPRSTLCPGRFVGGI
jgi:glycolate oxidase FAD binding subunit